MKNMHHPVIVYLVVSIMSLISAYIFFKGGGSLAEITGTEKTLVGFAFKAGGVIAGFIIIFAISQRAILKFDKNLKDRNPDLDTIRNEFLKIMYDGDFLDVTSDRFKERAWKNITQSINKTFYPHISEDIVNIIYKKFIPQKLEHYHKDYVAYYSIKETEDKLHIEIIESLKYVVVSKSKEITLDLFEKVQGLNDPNDKSEVVVSKLLVNGKDYSRHIPANSISTDRKFKKIVMECKLRIEEAHCTASGKIFKKT